MQGHFSEARAVFPKFDAFWIRALVFSSGVIAISCFGAGKCDIYSHYAFLLFMIGTSKAECSSSSSLFAVFFGYAGYDSARRIYWD